MTKETFPTDWPFVRSNIHETNSFGHRPSNNLSECSRDRTSTGQEFTRPTFAEIGVKLVLLSRRPSPLEVHWPTEHLKPWKIRATRAAVSSKFSMSFSSVYLGDSYLAKRSDNILQFHNLSLSCYHADVCVFLLYFHSGRRPRWTVWTRRREAGFLTRPPRLSSSASSPSSVRDSPSAVTSSSCWPSASSVVSTSLATTSCWAWQPPTLSSAFSPCPCIPSTSSWAPGPLVQLFVTCGYPWTTHAQRFPYWTWYS